MKKELFLFPIPNSVCFPHTKVDFHVFEPRYRAMVKAAAGNQGWIAISHVEEMRAPAQGQREKATDLSTNLRTYKPRRVFSAGPMEIEDITSDGRFFISIDMKQRFRFVEFLQEVPYYRVSAEPFDDEVGNENDTSYTKTCDDLRQQLLSLIPNFLNEKSDSSSKIDLINEVQRMDFEKLSFKAFQWFQFPPDQAQALLEMPSPVKRLETLCDAMSDMSQS